MKKALSRVLIVLMCLTMLPVPAFAANDFNISGSDKNDGYFNLISKQDWDIAPGITESEIVLNNDSGTDRQVIHVMEADMNNAYTKVIGSYAEMNTSKFQTSTMDVQAAWIEENWDWNVVGAMNTCLSWYTGYTADQVGRPLGFMMLDGEVLWDSCDGFPTVLVINKDKDADGNARPSNIPKVEMTTIRSSADLDSWEEQVIPVSSGFIVKDGVNQYSASHGDEAPRSVVGIKADGTVVIMENDGRQSPYSAGMCMYELAETMIGLGCTYAVNCDGGGSSQFLSQRPGEELKVNNSPSDGSLRPTTQGILFITTAPSNGEFVRASVSAPNEYYTPGSKVQFTAIGADLAGGAATIPSDVYWQISDSSLGSIDVNGLFVSNGTAGVVTVQLVYNEKVVGECSINIVVPQTLAFSLDNITVPYGKTVTLDVVAKYELNEVVLKDGDVIFKLSDNDIGTISGDQFTATSDESKTNSEIHAELRYDDSVTDSAMIKLGKSSKVVWDFEKGPESISSLSYYYKNNINDYNVIYNYSDTISVVSAIDGGKVRNGNYALKVESINNSITMMGWAYTGIKGFNIDLTDAVSLSFWLYVPEGSHGCEFDIGNATVDLGYEYKYGTGWHYITLNATDINKTTLDTFILYHSDNGCDATEYKPAEHPNYYQDVVFYIDDITVNYSMAVDDFDPPVISDVLLKYNGTDAGISMNGQKITENVVNITANATDVTEKGNYTGIDRISAAVYVDGVKVDTTCTDTGLISTKELDLANGVHTIRIEICDKNGNKSYVEKQIEIAVEDNDKNTIIYAPKDENLTDLPVDSIYWMNLTATKIEKVDKATVTVALDNNNKWCLDHMVLADGFTATYVIDNENNDATITITKTGDVTASDEMVLAQLPIRVWSLNVTNFIEDAKSYRLVAVETDIRYGLLIEVGGNKETFSSVKYSTVTEFNGTRTIKGTIEEWHKHTVTNLEDVAATCIKDGYTGRTYCKSCNSVVEWGTTVPATGHDWQFNDEGKLACTNNADELFTGVFEGKTYVKGVLSSEGWTSDGKSYYSDGVKLTGSHLIDGVMCTFDTNGIYQSDYSYTGFYNDGNGWMYFMSNFQKKGFVVIDGATYYFDDTTGYAPIESFTLAGDRIYKVEGEKGKVIGAWDTFMVNGVERKRYYYSLRYYKNQWLEIDGEKYYFDNDGYALIGKRAIAHSGAYLGAYEFDNDGKFLGSITGPFVDAESGAMYIAEDGVLACNKLVKYGEDYYFARNNYLLITWATTLTEDQTGGLLPAGEYKFGTDGKLQMLNGPVKDAYNDAYLNFYKDGVRIYEEGLYEYEGNYYYVRSNGLLLTWGMYITKTNNLLPAGEYKFGEDGKLQMLNGPVKDAYNDAYLNFYKDGVRVYEEGLYEYEDNYYYVRSNGLLLTWGMYITKTNDLLPAGEYKFGTDGKLQMLNGPVKDAYNDTYLNFYKDGVRVYEEGLYEYEDNYYYVRSNGLLLTWGMYITKTNNLLPAGEYKFGTDGKLQVLNGPVKDAYNDTYLNFYKDGVRIYEEGLYEYEGDYYYVRHNGLLITWETYVSEEKANGLVSAGRYKFGEDGKMII